MAKWVFTIPYELSHRSGSSGDLRLWGSPLPDTGAIRLQQKIPKPGASSLTNPHRSKFFMRNFFLPGRKIHQQVSKIFPDTRPQFQNDFITFRYEKNPAQCF
jgi:hypothetical protein